MLLAEGRQFVVMIDHILGVIHPAQMLPRQTQPFCPLRSGCHQNGLKSQPTQVIQRQIPLLTDQHIAKILDIGQLQNLPELSPQTGFHFNFIRVNAVFCQPAGFNVPVEQHHLYTLTCQFSCGK
ncbi:hypothetical protein AC812_06995 [Bellilinea caldifistulae]|uniref:Uncharacterized protein n=1 Tax=Bellilinea caldifistulae TaxID=360411 RepID=A0A0P6Y453_9CHLR|nr:hypothetical protein AC812_06995 [Bellilinea caldifistulae]